MQQNKTTRGTKHNIANEQSNNDEQKTKRNKQINRTTANDTSIALWTVATMTQLEPNGRFFLDHCLPYSDSENILKNNENDGLCSSNEQ